MTPETPGRSGARVDFVEAAKTYGDNYALFPTSLSIPEGEFFAIIGPSGSGKSTLLSLVAGFALPSQGDVRVAGNSIIGVPPYRRNFGMVFQNYAIFPHMTVAENVAFPLRMRGLPRAEIATRVSRALDMVRLSAFADRSPDALSGGQRQRVALARASVYEPPLLLMDEPLGALDKNLREEMQDEIKALQTRLGATVVYVTHDQQEAAFMADRIAVMRDGRVEQIGEPRAIYNQPANDFVAGFLGEASLLGVAREQAGPDGGRIATTTDGLTIRCRSGAVTARDYALCIRPENIQIGAAAAGLDNCQTGRVEDAGFATGTLRYRIRIGADSAVIVRVPSATGTELLPRGAEVAVGWAADAAVLVRK